MDCFSQYASYFCNWFTNRFNETAQARACLAVMVFLIGIILLMQWVLFGEIISWTLQMKLAEIGLQWLPVLNIDTSIIGQLLLLVL